MTTNSSAASAISGIPGRAMSTTSTALVSWQHTITVRRGRRSASPPSSGPPTSHGTYVTA